MIYTLENDILRLTFREQGGEMRSITEKADGTEYLWDGNPAWWKYSSPILFPIIAKLWEGKYRVDGKEYELPSHGFGRTSNYTLVKQEKDSIRFALGWSEETLACYPYKFRLEIGYELHGNRVDVLWQVRNEGEDTMFFSIGAHPALRCPIVPGETIEDCFLEFNCPEQAEKFAVTPDAFLKPEHVPGIKGKELPLSWDFFAQGTWIFDSLKSDTIAIRSRKSKKSIRIHFPDFPFLALWSPEKGGAPFICIEPWFGHADMEGYTGDFRRRHGTQELAPGKEFNAGYSFTVGS